MVNEQITAHLLSSVNSAVILLLIGQGKMTVAIVTQSVSH